MHESKIHCEEPDSESLTWHHTFRSTEAEGCRLKEHARQAGISVSALTRRRVHGHPPPTSAAPALNREAYVELARSAANLNQLTHHLNQVQVAGQSDVIELAAVRALVQKLLFEVAVLRAKLIGASEK